MPTRSTRTHTIARNAFSVWGNGLRCRPVVQFVWSNAQNNKHNVTIELFFVYQKKMRWKSCFHLFIQFIRCAAFIGYKRYFYFPNPLNHFGALTSSGAIKAELTQNASGLGRRTAFDVPAFECPTKSSVGNEPPAIWFSPLSLNAILRHAFGDEILSRISSLRYFVVASFAPKWRMADGTHCASKSRSSCDKITFGGVVSEKWKTRNWDRVRWQRLKRETLT